MQRKRKLYLITPRSTHGSEHELGPIPNITPVADAAMVTVAALVPDDKFEIKLCDENVEPIDFDYAADYVGITGKQVQAARMVEVAARFRARGIPVIFGGPHVSLVPDEAAPHCDVLVRGELEGIAEGFFDDLYRGEYRTEYIGPRGYFTQSPVPRWDLYPNHRALMGALQTSRGCPFECEFCDVIAYLGRKQAHKPLDHVVAELEALHRTGYRRVYLVDDNLTVFRNRARELLRTLADWNAKQAEPMSFLTQLSVEVAAHDDMLALLAAASVRNVYIGIETPNQESLKETKKRQNVGVDMVEATERFARHGILVQTGGVLGFDNDGPDIFERHLAFAQTLPVPTYSPVPLYAAHATPLRARMAAEGRLILEPPMSGPVSNIRPAQMSRAALMKGIHWLSGELYSSKNFEQRTMRMIELFPTAPEPPQTGARDVVTQVAVAVHAQLAAQPDTAAALVRILSAVRKKPSAREAAFSGLFSWVVRRAQLNSPQPNWDELEPKTLVGQEPAAKRHTLPLVV